MVQLPVFNQYRAHGAKAQRRSQLLPRWLIERVGFRQNVRSYHGVVFIDCLRCERWTMIFGLHFVAIIAMRSYRFLRQAGALIRK